MWLQSGLKHAMRAPCILLEVLEPTRFLRIPIVLLHLPACTHPLPITSLRTFGHTLTGGMFKIPAVVTAISPLLDVSVVTQLLDAFFQHIQPIHIHSLVHEASLMHRFWSGILGPSLTLAILGTAYEIIKIELGMEVVGRNCLSRTEALIMDDITSPSAVKTQVLVLVTKAHCRHLRATAACMLFAVAARAAYTLSLNHEALKLSFLNENLGDA
jgi:hypothetical protein